MSKLFFVSIVARPADVITENGNSIIAPSGATTPSTCSITCEPIVTLLMKNRTLSVHEPSAMHMFAVPSAVAIPREKSSAASGRGMLMIDAPVSMTIACGSG